MYSKHFSNSVIISGIFIYLFIVHPFFYIINFLELELCPITVYILQAWHVTEGNNMNH